MTDIQIRVIDRLDTATFEELAAVVEESVQIAGDHARASVQALIDVGGALCAMRDRMPGQYHAWLTESNLPHAWAGKCQRLYTYQHHLSADVFLPWRSEVGQVIQPSLSRAIDSLTHLPSLTVAGGAASKTSDEQVARVRQLKRDGLTQVAIAEIVGVSKATAYRIVNPAGVRESDRRANAKRKARRAEAAAAGLHLKREERDRLAKASGKELSIAYAAVRQALSALARMDVGNGGEQVRRTMDYLTAAETNIVDAMRVERTDP